MFQLELGRDIDVFLVRVSSVRVNDVQLRSMPGVEAGVVVVVLQQVRGGAGLCLPGRQHQVGGPGQDVVSRGLLPGLAAHCPVLDTLRHHGEVVIDAEAFETCSIR